MTANPTGGGRPCPLCDRPMARRHCKYVCPSHGVVYDCSDTFWH
ncbi:HVO_2523 family zinc finger protein [Halalkaliarchaeum sp. AArc-GB]|nr:HVO_2523 family zinc finger protein [Halalkaliarchaeum sp. AArc-GB]MDR5672390.1 HVO_2523 family zinc finger protein [Halalkaliarchaeum sp. AArc-GB]